jgi:hypothetical protein
MRCNSEPRRISQTLWEAAILTGAVICISSSGYGRQIAASPGAVPSSAHDAREIVKVLGTGNGATDASSAVAASNSGNSAPQSQHPVVLTWKPSTKVGIKYNLYRSVTKGECLKINSMKCQKMNLSPLLGTTYIDNTVQPGQSYFYVTKAVDLRGKESNPSNEAQAVVSPPKP